MKIAAFETNLRIGTCDFALVERCRYWPLNLENTHKNTTEKPEKETTSNKVTSVQLNYVCSLSHCRASLTWHNDDICA
jgi:hypothetical protein